MTILLTGELYVVAEIEAMVTLYLVPGTALETSAWNTKDNSYSKIPSGKHESQNNTSQTIK